MYARDEHTLLERRDPLIGTVFGGRYRVDSRLAAGGFGAVYRGTDVTQRVEVAIKVLHKEFATDASVAARFRREGETLVQLRDPHTVSALALGETDDGTMYLVMELLHGESLYDRYHASGTMPWRRVVRIAREVCSSLAEAHALGVVHRDLKPANIHLERRGDEQEFVKVVDFGIAKLLTPGASDLTHAGQMIGTFDYMSPEQMVGGMCTGRSDIYTLGVVMFEMISGERPFGEVNGPTGLLAVMVTKVPPLLSSLVDVPAELDRLIARCLERDQDVRVQSVEELAAALDELLHDDVGDAVTRIVHALDAASLDAGASSSLTRATTLRDGEDDTVDERTAAERPPRALPKATPAPVITSPVRSSAPMSVRPQAQQVMDVRGVSWAPPPPANAFPMPAPMPARVANEMPALPAPAPPRPTPAALPATMKLTPAMALPVVAPPLPLARTPTPAYPLPVVAAPGSLAPLPSYDITQATRHDALIRRIVWVSALVIALIIVAVVAHHLR